MADTTADRDAAIRRLASAAMGYGVSLATEGREQLAADLLRAGERATLADALMPHVEKLLAIRPRLVDDLREVAQGA